ncbi:PAS domain-containing protein [Azohydromonas lata]|uniref:PAS domain-containing protein n=1 Tax=Azohydromonas lata TaxID=45677 RepID=UPI000A033BF4
MRSISPRELSAATGLSQQQLGKLQALAAGFLSRRWYEFTGQSPENALGFGWLNAVHPDDRPTADASFRTLRPGAGPSSWTTVYAVPTADGAGASTWACRA